MNGSHFTPKSLKQSAGAGLIWGVAFTFGRDIIQFASMLILVRILSPEVYGQFALAQTVQLFIAVLSLKAIVPFALQAREPNTFDWELQFTAGAVLNTVVFIISLLIAGAIYFFGTESQRMVGAVLAVMALVFPAEIIGTHYFTWLQAHHVWMRMRLLFLAGSLLGSLIAVICASVGLGVFALAVGNLCFILPLIADYAIRRPFPLSFNPRRLSLYEEGWKFGLNRVAAGGLQAGTNLAEQSIISGIFGFSALGIYTRSIGLAQITSGRIGPVVSQTLYPVITRAEASSDRYRRFAAILFQGVLWTSVPAAAFLGLEAERLVHFLYGEKWSDVVPLMGAAAALLALRGLHLTMNQIMLANFQQRECLRIDLVAAGSMLAIVLSTAFLGLQILLIALGIHAALVLCGTTYFAVRGGAIAITSVIRGVSSCVVAVAGASASVQFLPGIDLGGPVMSLTLSLTGHCLIFGAAYTLILRMVAFQEMAILVDALPLSAKLRSVANVLLFKGPKRPA